MTDLHTRLLLFLAILLWGIAGALQKVAVGKMSVASVQLVGVVTALFVIVIYYMISAAAKTPTWTTSGTYWGILAALTSVMGSILFVYLLRGRDASSLMGYAACYPLVTFIIAILFMGEAFTTTRLVGIGFVLFGLMIMGR